MTDTYVNPDAIVADALTPAITPGDALDWQIDGRRTAEWAIRKCHEANADFAEATEPAQVAIEALQAKIAELQEFIDAQAARRDHTVEFFEAHLKVYLRRVREGELRAGKDPDKARKSIKLAGGTITSRAGTDRIEVRDLNAVVEWFEDELAAGSDVAGIVQMKVSQRDLRSWVTGTGEVPPGVIYEPATEEDRTYGVKLS